MSITLDQLPTEYRLGHELIDGQHEILFQLYRELTEYCGDTEYELELDIILLSLKTYVETHFRCEEGLMESAGYQGLLEHRSEHQGLEKQVMEQIERFNAMTSEEEVKGFALEMKIFLFNWLANHIAETDKKFCQSLH
jgi:hemerythrin